MTLAACAYKVPITHTIEESIQSSVKDLSKLSIEVAPGMPCTIYIVRFEKHPEMIAGFAFNGGEKLVGILSVKERGNPRR
jgi:hypothetical protein